MQSRICITETSHLKRNLFDRHQPFRIHRRNGTTHHQLNQLRLRHLRGIADGNRFAIPQYRDAVGYRKNLFQPVRDVDHGRTLCAQLHNQAEQVGCLALTQQRCRLVHQQDLRLCADCLCNFDDLLLGHAQRFGEPRGVDTRAHRLQQLLRTRRTGLPIHAMRRAALLQRQRNVLSYGKIGKQRGLLIDRRDPERSRKIWVVLHHRVAEYE